RTPERRQDALPLFVIHGKNTDVAVFCLVRAPVSCQQADVTNSSIQRRLECSAPKMLEIVEGENRLEHGHLHLLSQAGALSCVQGHANARGKYIPAELVNDDRWIETRLAVHLTHQGGDAALALDDVIERREVSVRPVGPV